VVGRNPATTVLWGSTRWPASRNCSRPCVIPAAPATTYTLGCGTQVYNPLCFAPFPVNRLAIPQKMVVNGNFITVPSYSGLMD
jgi:hypothetical protein